MGVDFKSTWCFVFAKIQNILQIHITQVLLHRINIRIHTIHTTQFLTQVLRINIRIHSMYYIPHNFLGRCSGFRPSWSRWWPPGWSHWRPRLLLFIIYVLNYFLLCYILGGVTGGQGGDQMFYKHL